MIEMTPAEYRTHVLDTFGFQHVDKKENFIYSSEALLRGLDQIECDAIEAEEEAFSIYEGECTPNYIKIECSAIMEVLRRVQVVANILLRGLEPEMAKKRSENE